MHGVESSSVYQAGGLRSCCEQQRGCVPAVSQREVAGARISLDVSDVQVMIRRFGCGLVIFHGALAPFGLQQRQSDNAGAPGLDLYVVDI